jgi:serine/threonine protein kinase
MERLGPSLHSYFLQCGKLLSLKTTCMVAVQMICRLEYLHQRSHIHRDIKPDNFVFGVGTNAHILYIIDMGLAQRYRDMKSFVHRPYKEDRGLAGTARYVSVNVHLGVEQSCRDDLESVGYVLISLRKGRLPWQSLKGRTREKKEKDPLAAMKMETTPELLCHDLPGEFLQYIQKVRQLTFDQRPQYAVLRAYFISLMVKNNYAFDFAYDWVIERGRRIFDAITGQSDQTKVIIPTSPAEIAAAGRVQEAVQQKSFYQPLPFFSIVNEASRFVGMSKRATKETDRPRSVYLRIPDEQTMFVLDHKRTRMSAKPFSEDFCAESGS